MKHLRLLNILIVMLMLVAWAPAPSVAAAVAPAAPTLVAPASGALIDGYQPDFKWNQPTYAVESYDIEFSFDATFKNASKQIDVVSVPTAAAVETYNPDFDLPSNSKIYWRVRAVTATGPSNWSSGRNVRTKPLPAGALLDPTANERVTSLRPLFTWTAPTDPADGVLRSNKFDLQVRLKDGGVVKTATVTGSEFQYPSDLKPNTAYQWHIRAKGLYFSEPYPATWEDFTTPNPPTAPAQIGPKNAYVLALNEDPTFTWKASTSPESLPIEYLVELSTSAKFDVNNIRPPATEEPTLTLTDDLITGTYYWRVRAVDEGGAMSNWSAVRTIKTQPSLKVTVVESLDNNVKLSGIPVTIAGTAYTTDGSGVVSIPSITPGTKAIAAAAGDDDYVTKKLSVSVPAGVAREVVIPLVHLPMKVTLSWTSGQNLDLHMWIPEDYNWGDDSDRGHIRHNNAGSTTKAPYARLSGDVVKGGTKGETIVIQNRYPGDYYVAVYNFYSNESLPTSGAVIKTYRGNMTTPMDTHTVPSIGTGRWWLAVIIHGEDGTLDFSQSNIRTASPGPYDPDGGTYAVPEE